MMEILYKTCIFPSFSPTAINFPLNNNNKYVKFYLNNFTIFSKS